MSHIDRVTCEETFKRLDDFLDSELDEEEMQLVRAHLKGCDVCSKEYLNGDAILNTVRDKLDAMSIPEGLKQRVFTRLEQEMKQQGG